MAFVATALSFLLIEVDQSLDSETVQELGFLYSFGPEGARAILSAISSSMITVAGLTFSMTMVTLQLATTQYGPGLLRNFMRDRGNQIVLGTFIATFVYCLMVLRTVRGVEGSSFVPHISVAFGVLLALSSLAVLIYFIHHVASTIRIETLLSQLALETCGTIDRLYPECVDKCSPDLDGATEAAAFALPPSSPRILVRSGTSGYVQQIDFDDVIRIAKTHDLCIWIASLPGDFVNPDDVIMAAHSTGRLPPEVSNQLRSAAVVGDERTPDQDLAFSIRRIVEIAQRALSPSANDPTTALYCIDRLGEAFVRLAGRKIPSPNRLESGKLRVVSAAASLDELACPAFAAIARYSLGDADVAASLLRTICMVVNAAGPSRLPMLLSLKGEISHRAAVEATLKVDQELITSAGRDAAS